jgi:DNA repair exonuclease SbcCD ATPase subunit
LAKARTQEKEKLYSQLEQSRTEAKDGKMKLESASTEVEELRRQLQDANDTSLSEQDKLAKRLHKLEGKIETLAQEKEAAITAASEQQVAFELKLYREQRLRASNVMLPELVFGTSVEEIDASIKLALEKEQQMESAIRDRMMEELGNQIPTESVAVESTQNKTQSLTNFREREQIVKLDANSYAQARSERLKEAISQLPANHPFRNRR